MHGHASLPGILKDILLCKTSIFYADIDTDVGDSLICGKQLKTLIILSTELCSSDSMPWKGLVKAEVFLVCRMTLLINS